MFRLTRAQVQPIGVDLGSDSIKMLQLEIVDNNLAVVAAARQAMPPEVRDQPVETRLAAAAGLVRQMLRQNPFNGRNVVLALPREIVQIKNLRMPPMPAAEMPAALAFEARNVFPFDTDTAQLRHLPAGEVRQGSETRQEVIVLAAPDEEVDRFVEQFHGSGAIISSLDVEACAVYRSIERFIRRREDETDVHVMIDIGWRQTLVVIGRGREISFIKPIEIGGRQLHEAVARKLGISDAETRNLRHRLGEAPDTAGARDPVRQAVYDAMRSVVEELGREIALCLRYYSVTFRGSRPTRLRVVGGEASDSIVHALLNTALPMPVEAGKPLYSVNTSKIKPADRRGPMCEWAVAFGLALKETTARFGARDGKPRDAMAPRLDVVAPPVTAAAVAAMSAPATAAPAMPRLNQAILDADTTLTTMPAIKGGVHA